MYPYFRIILAVVVLIIYNTCHVDFVVVHEYACTEEKREEQFVVLKEGSTDIAVQAEGEVVIDVDDTLLKTICMIM